MSLVKRTYAGLVDLLLTWPFDVAIEAQGLPSTAPQTLQFGAARRGFNGNAKIRQPRLRLTEAPRREHKSEYDPDPDYHFLHNNLQCAWMFGKARADWRATARSSSIRSSRGTTICSGAISAPFRK